MTEIWKDIPGYKGFYQASDRGKIKSLPRNGTIKQEKVIVQRVTWNGRMKIILRKLGKEKTFNVHRLIALTFIVNPENKPCINHIDGNPKNNNVENLEWVTYSENMSKDFETNRRSHKGVNHNNRKLTPEQVKQIREMHLIHQLYHKDIAKIFNISRATVTLIINNKIWNYD